MYYRGVAGGGVGQHERSRLISDSNASVSRLERQVEVEGRVERRAAEVILRAGCSKEGASRCVACSAFAGGCLPYHGDSGAWRGS